MTYLFDLIFFHLLNVSWFCHLLYVVISRTNKPVVNVCCLTIDMTLFTYLLFFLFPTDNPLFTDLCYLCLCHLWEEPCYTFSVSCVHVCVCLCACFTEEFLCLVKLILLN
jgi:hypothetical protein